MFYVKLFNLLLHKIFLNLLIWESEIKYRPDMYIT